MAELIPGVGAGSLLRSELLADDRSTRIGAVYRLDYNEATVLTHDRWKFEAGGIPNFRFSSLPRRTSTLRRSTTTKFSCCASRGRRPCR